MLSEEIKNLHFLVTDDYESMRMMIGSNLRDFGITNISFCKSGSEAVSYIQSQQNTDNPVQFLITDLVMDNGTGIELATQVRSTLKLDKLPILMITSKSDISLVIASAKAGVNNYIIKPWELEDLQKKILSTIEKAK